MNIDDFITENEILIGEPIEEKPQEEKKEEIKTGGQKSVQTYTTLSGLRNQIINIYNGGDTLTYINIEVDSNNTRYYFLSCFNNEQQYTYYISYSDLISYPYETVNVNDQRFIKYKIWDSTDECIGLNILHQEYNTNQIMVEVLPKTGQSIGDNPTLSSNDYSEYLETIISRLEGVEDGVQHINDNLVSIGNGSGGSNNNQTGSVSQNILTTPINQYNLTDSLIVIELSIGLVVGIILLIRRLIYKWN